MPFLPLLIIVSMLGLGAQQPDDQFPPGGGPPSGEQQQPGGPPPPVDDMSPAEIQRLFDGYLLIQVQDALGLTDQQFAQVVPKLKALQDARRRHVQERGRLMMELQRLTRPGGPGRGPGPAGDEAMIKERLALLQENDTRLAADLRRAYDGLAEVLDVRQQGRFRVFEEQIERKKLDLLLRARQNPNRPMPNRPMPKRQPPPGI